MALGDGRSEHWSPRLRARCGPAARSSCCACTCIMLSDIDHSCSVKASSVMKPAPGTAICQEIVAWGITVVRMCRVCADSFAFSGPGYRALWCWSRGSCRTAHACRRPLVHTRGRRVGMVSVN
ncbi:Uncharacterized protein PBTT_08717 [Plasmodiophora brassicae]